MQEQTRRAVLLGILYLSFISLGLPDTLLGVAWPQMRLDFCKPLEAAGLLLSLTTLLSVASSLCSPLVMRRWHTGTIITVCGLMTCTAMVGYALSMTWTALLVFTVFFGIGQGAVDTAVNTTMSNSYSAKHMNWVHACWGIGASIGPMIMTGMFAASLTMPPGGSSLVPIPEGHDISWRLGYLSIAAIQLSLSLIFLFSLSLWKRSPAHAPSEPHPHAASGTDRNNNRIVQTSGVLFYLLYPGIESVAGLWAASYMVDILHKSMSEAAGAMTLFWFSLMLGRVAGGFLTIRWTNVTVIRVGCAVALCGILLIWSAASPEAFRWAMACMGLGLGPLYPCMMHDTPRRLHTPNVSRQIGFQVGAAQAGAALLPPVVGWIAGHASLVIFCPALLLALCLLFLVHELSCVTAHKRRA